jgi:methylmalonyl-CoA/ethylmalonyl-CoA epimerase
MKRLKEAGFELLNETPKPGADNKLVCFLHPKNTNGVLIELCMEKK